MKHVISLSLAALLGLALASAPAGAQDAKKSPAAKGAEKAAAPAKEAEKGGTKVTGPVKGAPTGDKFVVAVPRKGPVNVDASKAKVRVNGKFGKVEDIKGGTMVTVEGTMVKDTLMATEVKVHARGGKKADKEGVAKKEGDKK